MKLSYLQELKKSKNLLAFSAGVDSSALFFALDSENIEFDLAIVDYQVRAQSKAEINHAKSLAQEFNKQIFIKTAPIFESNFEANARAFRYDFFAQICKQHDFENLILAHQLNDRLEWFLMQFCKGAGLQNLSGFGGFESRGDFNIVRPMISISRDEIYKFLHENNILFFEDSSNFDERFKRNFFRKNFANDLIKNFENGIKNSLNILEKEREIFCPKAQKIFENLFVFGLDSEILNLNAIDLALKNLGYVMSQNQRIEIVKSGYSCILAQKFVIDKNEKFIFIGRLDSENLNSQTRSNSENSLNSQNSRQKITMPKKMRELFRIHKIPPKVRPIIFEKIKIQNLDFENSNENFLELKKFLEKFNFCEIFAK